MTRPKLRIAGVADEGGPDEAVTRLAIPAPEMERATKAYRGARDAARAWRQFSPNPRHHDSTYWTLLTSLFTEPGMNRTRLIDRIMEGAGVSRSTAERSIKDARECGLITYEHAGAEVLLDLSDRLFNHCVSYFRDWMDRDKLNRNLGYDDDYGG